MSNPSDNTIWPPGIRVRELTGLPQPLEWECEPCLRAGARNTYRGRGTFNLCGRHSVMHVIEHHFPMTWRVQTAMPAGILPGDRGIELYLYAIQNAYLFTPEAPDRSQPGILSTISA